MAINLNKYLHSLLGVFFIFAGANHFMNSDFYLPLIPDYLPAPLLLNLIVGLIEFGLGVLLFVPGYSKTACYGIIVVLILFIPSHIYFIQIGSCVEDGLCIAEWFAWVRLLLGQPILIFWAWWVSRIKT